MWESFQNLPMDSLPSLTLLPMLLRKGRGVRTCLKTAVVSDSQNWSWFSQPGRFTILSIGHLCSGLVFARWFGSSRCGDSAARTDSGNRLLSAHFVCVDCTQTHLPSGCGVSRSEKRQRYSTSPTSYQCIDFGHGGWGDGAFGRIRIDRHQHTSLLFSVHWNGCNSVSDQ